MPNLSLTGQIPVELDHAFVITATSLDVSVSTPTQVKKGAFGPIGTAQGIPDVTASIRFAVPSTGLEVNLADLAAKPNGFTVSYALGVNKYAIIGCRISGKTVTNDPGGGNTEVSLSLTGTEEISL